MVQLLKLNHTTFLSLRWRMFVRYQQKTSFLTPVTKSILNERNI
jgi:hypothetical protein